MTWTEAAIICEENYGVSVNWEEEWFICPDCNEPILADDWDKFDICPICTFEWKEV